MMRNIKVEQITQQPIEQQMIELVERKKPDVVVLNVDMPRLDGVAIARRLKQKIRDPRLVFLTNRHNESRMREAFLAGARAYLLQQCDFKELVFAIGKVAVGEYYLTGPAGQELMLEYTDPRKRASRKKKGLLTPRELELARLLCDGDSTKEAADHLNISVKTAETHRASIMKKIGAKNVTDIVKYCIRNDIATT